jgi:hypothetical protein
MRPPLRSAGSWLALAALLSSACVRGDDPGEAIPPSPLAFTDVTPELPPWAPPAWEQSFVDSSALLQDLDDDGAPELLVTSLMPGQAYAWKDGAWRPTVVPGKLPEAALNASFDLDGDGVVEMLGGNMLVAPWITATPRVQLPGTRWNRIANLTLADVDADGWLDVVGAGATCGSENQSLGVFVRGGPGEYRLLDASRGAPAPSRQMSYLAAWLPLARPGLYELGEPCVEFTDAGPYFHAVALDEAGWPRLVPSDPLPDDALFRQVVGPLRQLADGAPMGAAVGDLDGDGVQDLVLALSPLLAVLQGRPDGTLVDRSASTGVMKRPGKAEQIQLPWGSAIVDLDLDGKNDLVVVHGNDSATRRDDRVGPQEIALYLNAGDYRFLDVTRSEALPRGQWKALVVDDFDCDGDADLFVGGNDQWPRIFRNDTDAAGHAISLQLQGTTSNALGVGAKVELWAEGAAAPQWLWVGGIASPVAFSRPMVFGGLGPATRAAVARITWPSGYVQEVRDLEGGRCHVVREPPLLAVAPPSRHARAGGELRLTVTPRAPDGSPVKGNVEARVTHGTAQARVDALPEGAVVVVTRATPGAAVVEVSIDGKPLLVRPRLWWD